MLPERYCDYLLALYTNGEELEDGENESVTLQRRKPFIITSILLLFLMIPFSFLMIYFTEFHSLLQLTVLLLFGFYSIWLYRQFSRKQYDFIYFPLIASLLLLLLFTMEASRLFTQNQSILATVIVVNFILWLSISIVKKIKLLQALSISCIIFTLLYIIFINFMA